MLAYSGHRPGGNHAHRAPWPCPGKAGQPFPSTSSLHLQEPAGPLPPPWPCAGARARLQIEDLSGLAPVGRCLPSALAVSSRWRSRASAHTGGFFAKFYLFKAGIEAGYLTGDPRGQS